MDKEWTYESIYAQCEALGEDEVQARLDENSWFGGREIAAKQWLRKRQRDRAAKEAAETREFAQQATTSRSERTGSRWLLSRTRLEAELT